MKSKKVLLLLLLIGLLLGVVSACSKEVVEEELPIYSYDTLAEDEIVIENDNLEFHFDNETTQFYIVKKSTGHIWYSNPQDADTDVIAAGINKKDLQATISLKYNTESGSPTIMNNYGSSIEKGNFSYEVTDNSIKVNYTIADLAKVYFIPPAVPESRFMEYYGKLDAGTQNKIKNSYKVYDINKVRKGENKDELLEKYPEYATEKIWELRESDNKPLMQSIEDAFATVGYNQEEYEKDLALYETTTTHDKPLFNVTVQYTLEEDGLRVSIPMNEIQFRRKYPLVELRPLAYFGAGNNTDEGFMLIPDGSGSIIYFNNGKSTQSAYKSDIYGWDYANYRDSVIDETRSNMPIFGISNKNASFLCILEEGASYAYLEADVAGRINSYNYVSANYNMIRSELMDISAKSDKTVRKFQEKLPDEVISQKYIFIDETDYTSMAVTYRNYLMAKHPELVKKSESKVPVAIEIVGAVDRTKHVLGIPTTQPDELTSYKEAKGMIEQLLSFGISDLNIKYNGWFNEGIIHKVPNKVKLINELGSKKDFKSLVSYAADNNVNLYLQATIQFVYENSMFDNFMRNRDSAKHINRKIVDLVPYNPIYYGETDYLYDYNLTKPKYYLKNLEDFAKEISGYGVKNVAFGDIGEILSSDYDRKKTVSREQAMKLQTEKLAELNKDGYSTMIHSGNIYAVPYADFIVDVNLSSRGYNITDQEIPFYEIVLHGLVSYAGSPMNLAADYEKAILKTAETGAGLYFAFMDADSFELQDSRYTKYFSADFNQWSEHTKELYQKMSQDFGHLYNQFITGHQQLSKGVYMTEYEDGTQVIVNYNENAYTHNDKVIPAKDYIVEGGKR